MKIKKTGLLLLMLLLFTTGCHYDQTSFNSSSKIPQWQLEMPKQYVSFTENGKEYGVSFEYKTANNYESTFFRIQSIVDDLTTINELEPANIEQNDYPNDMFSSQSNAEWETLFTQDVKVNKTSWIKYYGCTPTDKNVRSTPAFVLFSDTNKKDMIIGTESEGNTWSFFRAKDYAQWFSFYGTILKNAKEIKPLGKDTIKHTAIQNGAASTNVVRSGDGGFLIYDFLPIIQSTASYNTVSEAEIPVHTETKVAYSKLKDLPVIQDQSSIYTWCRYDTGKLKQDIIFYCENNDSDLFVAVQQSATEWELYCAKGIAGWFLKEVQINTRNL